MTRRAKDLIGKPVVSAANGERLGTVTDLLLDDAGTSLVGLVLSHGFMKGEQVLPAESLQTLGTDAVVSRSNEVIGAKEWHERQRVSTRASADVAPIRAEVVDETVERGRVSPAHRDETI